MSNTELDFSYHSIDTLELRLAGSWTLQDRLPVLSGLADEVESNAPIRRLSFDFTQVTDWDSGLLTFLRRVINFCNENEISIDQSGLPNGVQGLIRLAFAVPEQTAARRTPRTPSFLRDVGEEALSFVRSTGQIVTFLGSVLLAFAKLLRGRARFRWPDLFVIVQEVGAQALPIVSLISFLVGLILAFVGALQLQMFGAEIYIANLVGLGMAREMGAMMTAIIMAGRTGAAFAVEIGTMTVNEEVDALKAMGFAPMEFLVLPRMLALMLMLPLLTVYSDLMGMLGGAVVGTTLAGVGLNEYILQTQQGVTLVDFASGLLKALVYGVIVAVSGCLRGMQCGRSSEAVGQAATSAVVTSIVFIVVASAILTVIYSVLGI